MFKPSSNFKKFLGASLLGLVLGACNLPNEPQATAPDGTLNQNQTGKAVIHLPAFPAGSLAKSSSQPGPLFGCTFVLSIDIPGRIAPLIKSWNLLTFDGPLVVDHLPVGPATFTGHLVTLAGDATHAGSATVTIEPDQIVSVNLSLKSTAVGDAAICVDVEGLPATGCAISNPVSLRVLSACWSIQAALPDHSSEAGIVRINSGAGEGTTGGIQWESHATDSVSNIWADVKWGMMGFSIDHIGGAWAYQGPIQTDNSIQSGTIQSVYGIQLGTFSMTPMDCPE